MSIDKDLLEQLMEGRAPVSLPRLIVFASTVTALCIGSMRGFRTRQGPAPCAR